MASSSPNSIGPPAVDHTTVPFDELGKYICHNIISYLPATDILNLTLTAKKFGALGAHSHILMIESSAYIFVKDIVECFNEVNINEGLILGLQFPTGVSKSLDNKLSVKAMSKQLCLGIH